MLNPVLVEVIRGELVESIHRGAFAICDADGNLKTAIGDVETPIYTRSALKPIQALPLIESGAADAYGVSDEEVALACASHTGETMHTARVAAWLMRLGFSADDLICGPQKPGYESKAESLGITLATQTIPSKLHNNCSGKHAAFLTVARHLGASSRDYVNGGHPVQKAILETVKRLSDYADPAMGIDGCAAPNYALPLAAFAKALARMAAGCTPGGARVIRAMTAHPELVGGTARHCTTLMRAAKGKAAVKMGAEGVYAAMLPELGLGIALKIDDGATRASEIAIAVLLEKLQIISGVFSQTPILNTRGAEVGMIRPADILTKLQ